ncbi:MAG: SCO family protein [Alphaproteobacteria bacterium]|nr:MAG: SCO family protein [Alphaproteobacteria bacterium]
MPGLFFRPFWAILAVLWFSGALTVLSASAQEHGTGHTETAGLVFNRDAALEISQGAIGRPVGDYQFTDSDGKIVSLSDFHGTPVAINLIYTSCSHTCPMIVESLKSVVKISDRTIGAENLVILTIGFDTQVDTPRQMNAYKSSHNVSRDNWLFLSADEATIVKLSRDLGFQFESSPYGFDHLAQVTLLDRSGKVYYQIYGQTLPTPNFVEPLKRLVFGAAANFSSLNGILNQVQLFCTIYNPNTGRYQFDYSFIFTIIIGLLCLSLVAIFLVREFRKLRHGI